MVILYESVMKDHLPKALLTQLYKWTAVPHCENFAWMAYKNHINDFQLLMYKLSGDTVDLFQHGTYVFLEGQQEAR